MIREIIILFGILSSAYTAHIPFFRRDYHYNREYDSFYKAHLVSNISYEAGWETCIGEGSKLFYPKSSEEWKILRSFIEVREPGIGEYVSLGRYNELGVGELITIDGLPTPDIEELIIEENDNSESNCVYMNIENGKTRSGTCSPQPGFLKVRGFLCKKEIYPSPCQTIDKNYEYEETTNKCFKLSRLEKTWLEAKHTCFLEGGSLLVTKTSKERDVIAQYLRKKETSNRGFFVGYKVTSPNNSYTVKGEPLSRGFYIEERDIVKPAEVGECGVYTRTVDYNKGGDNVFITDSLYPCELTLPYICEMNAN